MNNTESEMDTTTDEDVNKCRFCWSSQADPENPLLASCKCAGSMGYIHFNCLRGWLDVKKQMKISPSFSSFYWKSFECEICKKAYPCKFFYD
jgi:E3 ubiquitin-protein ligase DOA10